MKGHFVARGDEPTPSPRRPLGTIHPVVDEECTEPFGHRCIRSLQTELSEPTQFDSADQEQMVVAGDAS